MPNITRAFHYYQADVLDQMHIIPYLLFRGIGLLILKKL